MKFSWTVKFGWTTPVDVAAVNHALTADPAITHVAMVHHQTKLPGLAAEDCGT